MGKKLPEEALEFFRKQGSKGGKIGGKRSLETMTPKERTERARKAVTAREAKRATTLPAKATGARKPGRAK